MLNPLNVHLDVTTEPTKNRGIRLYLPDSGSPFCTKHKCYDVAKRKSNGMNKLAITSEFYELDTITGVILAFYTEAKYDWKMNGIEISPD